MDLVGKKLGKYQVIEAIGQGGMASVYKAYQPGVERHVAIKVMHPHLATSPDFVERFLREARSAGNLHHPHIMPVIDCDTEAGVHYLVLNYVQGGTLEEYLQQEKRLPTEDALRIATQLGDALAYAHQNGMIHRDIKPANIMFVDGERQQSLLADFGIARLQDEMAKGLTATGALVGTPNYMSPEAAMGESCDERSDIYSLGIVLYEMVTGQTPYQADTLYSFLMKQANEPLAPPCSVNPDLPKAVEQIILRALAKSPAERFPSASAFVDAVRRATADLTNPSAATTGKSISHKENSKPMNEKSTKSRSWIPLAAVGAGVVVVAAITAILLITTQPDGSASETPGTQTIAESIADETTNENNSNAKAEVPADVAQEASATPKEIATEVSQPAAEEASGSDNTGDSTETDTTEPAEGVEPPEDGAEDNLDTTANEADLAEGVATEEEASDEDSTTEATTEAEAETVSVPTQFRRKVGTIQVHAIQANGPDGTVEDEITLHLNQIPFPPPGSRYELWLGADDASLRNIGALEVISNVVEFSAKQAVDPTISYASAAVSLEDDNDPESITTVVFTGTLVSTTERTVMAEQIETVGNPETVLDSLSQQLALAVQHGGFLQEALDGDNLAGARTHAEHLVNIIDGESGENFGDLDRDGVTQNPGDGIGVRVYLEQVEGLMSVLTAIAPDTVDTYPLSMEMAESARKQALQIFAADTVTEAQAMSARLNEQLVSMEEAGTIDSQRRDALLTASEQLSQPKKELLASFNLVTDFTPLSAFEFDLTEVLEVDTLSSGIFRLTIAEESSESTGSENSATTAGGSSDSYGDGYASTTDSTQPMTSYAIDLPENHPLPDGEQPHGWMANDAGEFFYLGLLQDTGSGLSLRGSTEERLIDEFDQVLITSVGTDIEINGAEGVTGRHVYLGRYAPPLIDLLRKSHVEDALANEGLLENSVQQLELAVMHTGFMQTGIEQEDLAEARRHAEHVINILIGEEGEFFGDIDKDGLPQNPGDGIGAVSYAQALKRELETILISMSFTPEQRFYAEQALASIENTLAQTDASLQKALQIFAADTASEAASFQRDLAILLVESLHGLDRDANGIVDPVQSEGGLANISTYLALISDLPLANVEE